MGTLLKAIGLKKPKVKQTPLPTITPNQSELEQILFDYIRNSMTPSEIDIKMEDMASGYFDTLTSDTVLTPDEEAQFNRQYELELQALNDQFAMDAERYGAIDMADLVSRGVLDSTTGIDQISDTQGRLFNELTTNKANLLNEKESAISDFETRKREAALAGYQLTRGYLDNKMFNTMNAASNLSSYSMGQRGLNRNILLNNKMLNQQAKQSQFNNLLSTTASVASFLL